jgi:hypothetical protein
MRAAVLIGTVPSTSASTVTVIVITILIVILISRAIWPTTNPSLSLRLLTPSNSAACDLIADHHHLAHFASSAAHS